VDDAAAVTLRGATKIYGTGEVAVRALDDIDLDLPGGEILVLLGASGSGKTTLLNLIGGIEEATSGEITVAGTDLGSLDADERTRFRREHVGFIFQFFNLIPTLTALENVQLIVELTGGDVDGCVEVLRSVGLGDRLGHFPGAMSGGEQQRVAVARALAKAPDLLLCDEPTGALDLATGRSVLSLLRRVQRDEGRTIIIVTHNSAIATMADRVVRLSSGRVIESVAVPEPVAPEDLTW